MRAKTRVATALTLAVAMTCQGTTSPDADLKQLSGQSLTVLYGKVVGVRTTPGPPARRPDAPLAEVQVLATAKGWHHDKVLIRFVPRQSDQPNLEMEKEYVLFLAGRGFSDHAESGGSDNFIFEVGSFDRGVVPVRGGSAFPHLIVDEPEQQAVCTFLERVAVESQSTVQPPEFCPPSEDREKSPK